MPRKRKSNNPEGRPPRDPVAGNRVTRTFRLSPATAATLAKYATKSKSQAEIIDQAVDEWWVRHMREV